MPNHDDYPTVALSIRANPGHGRRDVPFKAELETPYRTSEAIFDLETSDLDVLYNGKHPLAYGQSLYNQVFCLSQDPDSLGKGELHETMKEVVHLAARSGAGSLRIGLKIDTGLDEMHRIGWEYLSSSELGRSELRLAANASLAFYRYLPAGAVPVPINQQPRILACAAGPSELGHHTFNHESFRGRSELFLDRLNLVDQMDRLERLINGLKPLWAGTVLPTEPINRSQFKLILDELGAGEYHVLHLVCHGVVEGDGSLSLLFGREDDRWEKVSASGFVDEVVDYHNHLRLVVLEICHSASTQGTYSGLAQQLLRGRISSKGSEIPAERGGIPAVVGMQRPWYTGQTSERFCVAFYQALVERGNSVALAVQKGRSAVYDESQWDWGTPVLYLRSKDSRFFAQSAIGPIGPFQAPNLPTPLNYVERTEELTRLKEMLLFEHADKSSRASIAILHGVAAVGKSVMVSAFAHDEAVRRHFPDGVLWATLGKKPEIKQLLGKWGFALNDPDLSGSIYPSIEIGKAQLLARLAEKKCLLVLDDVWEKTDVDAFLVGGQDCLLLITSRSRDVAPQAIPIPLDEMDEDEAMKLMANWGGGIAPAEEPDARWLASELGYLPLALELIGAQARKLKGWKEARRRWKAQRLEALKRGRQPATKEDSILISLELSLDALREEDRIPYLQLCVFGEDNPFPAGPAGVLWKLDEFDTVDFLTELVGNALLKEEEFEGVTRYSFHGLLYEFMLARLGEKGLSETHLALIEGYRAQCGKRWLDLKPDNYIHDRLVWHLDRAGLEDEIHKLLRVETPARRNGWFLVRESLGQSAGYAADIRQAWEITKLLRQEKAGDELARQMDLHTRYTLILASLNSQAKNYPPALLEALVEAGHWTLDRALGYARQNPDLDQRVRILVTLASRLPETERVTIIREALSLADAVEERESRLYGWMAPRLAELGFVESALQMAAALERNTSAIAIAAIAPHLEGRDREAAVDLAVKHMLNTWDLFRADSLEKVAPLLTLSQLNEVWASAEEMESKTFRGQVLEGVVRRLAQLGDVDQAYDLANRIDDLFSRAGARAALVGYLPEPLKSKAIGEVLATIRSYDNAAWRENIGSELEWLDKVPYSLIMASIERHSWSSGVLEEMAGHLSEGMLAEILDFVLVSCDEGFQVGGLKALLPHLPPAVLREYFPKSLDLIRSIEDVNWRIPGLAVVLPFANEEELADLIREILDELRRATFFLYLSEVLDEIGPHIPSDSMAEVLEHIRSVPTEEKRVELLDVLAPHLPQADLPESLSILRQLDDFDHCALALAALAVELTGQEIEAALEIAGDINNDFAEAKALAVLAPRLSDGLLSRTREMARELMGVSVLAEVALPGLAPYFTEPEKTAILRDALNIVASSDDSDRAAWALEVLRDQLSGPLLEEAIESVRAFGRRVSEKHVDFAIAFGLATLLPRLSEPRKTQIADEILDRTAQIEEESDRVAIFDRLSLELNQALLNKARDIANQMTDAYQRATALGILMEGASGELRRSLGLDALSTLGELKPGEYLSVREMADRVIARVIPYFHELWIPNSDMHEEELTDNMKAMLPYGGNPGKSIDLMGDFDHDVPKTLAITRFAPLLPEAYFERALTFARDIEMSSHRADALVALGKHAPEPMREEIYLLAFWAAFDTGGDYPNFRRMPHIVRMLLEVASASTLEELWWETTGRLARMTRREVCGHFYSLAPLLVAVGGTGVVQEAFDALRDVSRWWQP